MRELRRGAESDADFEFAELIFGELGGNVARHAPGRINVRVTTTPVPGRGTHVTVVLPVKKRG